jgi:hypothetical protein
LALGGGQVNEMSYALLSIAGAAVVIWLMLIRNLYS